MRNLRWWALFGGLVLVLVGWSPAIVARAGTPGAPDGTATYLVRFRSSTAMHAGSGVATATLSGHRTRALGAAPLVIVRLSAAEAASVASDPEVAYVQPDTTVHVAATQTSPPWGLDRIDESSLPLDNRYTANETGEGVTVYVIDTGVTPGSEFTGRLAAGASFVADGHGTADCYGHGTHVAGTIGGTTYGVAKRVTIVPVRVLDCTGTGSSENTVRGLEWVAADHHAGEPAVVNLSLTGSPNKAEDDMVQALVAEGVTIVAAAGNDDDDACQASPGEASSALTVAASDATDKRAYFSNYGACVDLYAPGVDILSASATGGSALMSGTSMASPHVAGAAALLLAAHRSWTPAQVSTRVLQTALPSRVGGNPSRTPNRLLNIAPSIYGITPGQGSTGGTQTVTLTGRRFYGVTKVLFDGIAATDVVVADDHQTMTVTTPAHPEAGVVHVVVVSETSNSNRDITFTYLPAPVVSSVSPGMGGTGGGTTVTIRGIKLTGATDVRFGSHPATSFTVVSDTEIRAVSPAGSTGTVDVRVTTPVAQSELAKTDRFSYGRLAKVSAVSTNHGLTIGGERLTITGKYFAKGVVVLFRDVPGTSVKVYSATKLKVTVPAIPEGTLDIRVVNRFGGSAPVPGDRYTVRTAPAPAITKLSPATGFAVGGTKVTLTGTNLYGIRTVTFGRTEATIVSVTASKLVVLSPAHAVGDVDVRVTGAYGTSATAAATFSYAVTPPPVVTKVSPAKGSHKGGTTVTLTGKYFFSVTSVTFGGLAATKLKVTSTTRLTLTTPAHVIGKVDIVVHTATNLVSTTSTTARYTFT